MEIVILALLFVVGTIAGAVQAMRYLDRRRGPSPAADTDDADARD
ncbi:MAG: hypothetical protein QNJ91_16195 [Gammaproteobacteria bacterium]|nr:hypothetical protein [Gammaproteobacteria bacterium]